VQALIFLSRVKFYYWYLIEVIIFFFIILAYFWWGWLSMEKGNGAKLLRTMYVARHHNKLKAMVQASSITYQPHLCMALGKENWLQIPTALLPRETGTHHLLHIMEKLAAATIPTTMKQALPWLCLVLLLVMEKLIWSSVWVYISETLKHRCHACMDKLSWNL